MTAFLLDPYEKTVTEVDFPTDIDGVYDLLKCTVFEVVPLSNGDMAYVDEHGKLNITPLTRFIGFGDLFPHDLIAGRALVVGPPDDEGYDTSVMISRDVLEASVTFYGLKPRTDHPAELDYDFVEV